MTPPDCDTYESLLDELFVWNELKMGLWRLGEPTLLLKDDCEPGEC